jgi:hypothetical protein
MLDILYTVRCLRYIEIHGVMGAEHVIGSCVGYEGADWTYLAEDMDRPIDAVNTVTFLSGSVKGGEFLDKLGC